MKTTVKLPPLVMAPRHYLCVYCLVVFGSAPRARLLLQSRQPYEGQDRCKAIIAVSCLQTSDVRFILVVYRCATASESLRDTLKL